MRCCCTTSRCATCGRRSRSSSRRSRAPPPAPAAPRTSTASSAAAEALRRQRRRHRAGRTAPRRVVPLHRPATHNPVLALAQEPLLQLLEPSLARHDRSAAAGALAHRSPRTGAWWRRCRPRMHGRRGELDGAPYPRLQKGYELAGIDLALRADGRSVTRYVADRAASRSVAAAYLSVCCAPRMQAVPTPEAGVRPCCRR